MDKFEEERKEEVRQGPWKELWREKKIRISNDSPFSHFPSYQLRAIIIKGGDDLRQEVINKIYIQKNYKRITHLKSK